MFYMTKKIGRFYFIFLSFLLVSISGPSNSHEVSVKDLILYHPSLFFEKKGEGEAFFSVANEGSDSDYIIGIHSEFSKTVELYKYNELLDKFDNIGRSNTPYLDLRKSPLEIKPGESITFDSLGYMLVFKEVDSSLSWFDMHQSVIFFRDSGEYKIDFEVEYNE